MDSSMRQFLKEGGKHSENTLKYLSSVLNNPHPYPPHVIEILNSIRQHAEEDNSNFLHLQSILPHLATHQSINQPSSSIHQSHPAGKPGGGRRSDPVHVHSAIKEETASPSQVEQVGEVETAVSAGDDLFLLEGVDDSRSPMSVVYSECEEEEEGEADEGIYIPGKKSTNIGVANQRTPVEIAASLPVGIPWNEDMMNKSRRVDEGKNEEDRPTDIAASIQAMARSVYSSSVFGDNVFGELPRPRRNTMSKD
ncbi:uncharacterized protein LOC111706424 [Eurytemora carolleeae]|uniref:uncharacterized protein LOC111706424 n=1 Tax=Eurytemora carolleeae TaxID=1294199 RepID=UPI000C75A482|nr:uncharacterized protein LOC111706424 [Eurytemora carolleeae]|eukprot:XP_023335069.1 uncharacterized protein LOC111706424 [Eurytemora affinis]